MSSVTFRPILYYYYYYYSITCIELQNVRFTNIMNKELGY